MASVRHVGDVKYVMSFLIPIAARFPLRVEFDFFLELVVSILPVAFQVCEESFSGNECVIKVFRQASTGGGSDLGENGEFDLGISDLGEEGIRHGNRRSKACPTMSLWEVSRNANFMDHFKPKAEISSLPKVKEMCESSKSLLLGLLKKIDRVEEENTKIRAKSSILWAAMLLSWLVVFAMKMN
ncbi:unnamed protein product [Prunus armeniaca]